jgi:hypothetical protein
MAKLVPIEQAILAFLIILSILIISFGFYRHFRKFRLGAQSRVYIQLGDVSNSCTLPFFTLLFPPEFYIFKTVRQSQNASVSIQYGTWFAPSDKIKIDGIQVHISNPCLQIEINPSLSKTIPFFLSRKISRIIQKDHFIALILTDPKGKIISCTPLKPYSTPAMNHDVHPPLYPVLMN